MPLHTMPGQEGSRNAAKSHFRPKQRISHTKSRNGCYTCKLRRVKCDEVRPVCGACLIRGDDCVYPSPGDTRGQRRRQRPGSRERPSSESIHFQARNDTQEVHFCPLNFNLTAPEDPQNVSIQRESSLNMSDLNLLQHFILHTSKKMTLHKIKMVAWERGILDLAAANDFLMHLVLALAGIDILTTRDGHDGNIQTFSDPSISWSPRLHSIMEHHQLGLAGLQEALCAPAEPNAEALLAGSMLVVGFAFASLGIKDPNPSMGTFQNSSHGSPSAFPSQAPLQIQWLHLVRGVTCILSQFWSTLRRCRLRSLLFFNNANDDWKLCETELRSGVALNQNIQSKRLRKFATGANRALTDLRDICVDLRHSRNFEESSDGLLLNATPRSEQSGYAGGRISLSACEQVIGVVEDLYMRILYVLQMKPLNSQSPSDLEIQIDLEDAAISAWPHRLPEEFIATLDSHGNVDTLFGVSLTILAHLYSTIAIFEDIWYLGKTCDAEIYKINTLIHGLGDEELIRLMEWPVDIIE
ncbi:C6 finger domain protein, putative [Talaromyces stipitatus ATCC 10500]|uniref:C6 finger domain protein, putative n=1 Tax=Talaromyces stipitatus (strain ATCC 10500 / CBS 375.48 / QM 6759 / NRRL 1006) TaxID=441959 RepID=B8M9B2_TALSN|nr:C6 finger domain protein, putative [Talaromyces stipitatus ATCC 10500]EED17672.1 C6 finger domain protein, putative [Talaromyces stipitatus ATCC 10500]